MRLAGITLALFAASALGAGGVPAFGKRADKLQPPASGPIPVAFVLTEGFQVIDFAGPWEVFQHTTLERRGASTEAPKPFRPYVVSDSREPLRAAGGLSIVPDYTFDDAPSPGVVVVPAMGSWSDPMVAWLRQRIAQDDVVISVCTGAFGLAGTLDLGGEVADHAFCGGRECGGPGGGRRCLRGEAVLLGSGRPTSGIDLALHVVALYYGAEVAKRTAGALEHQGTGWRRAQAPPDEAPDEGLAAHEIPLTPLGLRVL